MNIILAIIVFSIIIIVHEFGHFIMAKANGVTVLEFSIGFGPKLLHYKFGDTDYSIKLLPFGGACVMLGGDIDLGTPEDEDSDDEENAEKKPKIEYDINKSFGEKSVWARLSILAAGPIFNFILAFVLAVVIVGAVGYDPCVVSYVEENSPAWQAGLRDGDLITKINNHNAYFSRELTLQTVLNPEKDLYITYTRDGNEYSTKVTPEYRKRTSYMVGFSILSNCQISSVENKSPAKRGGIRINDIIKTVGGTSVNNSKEVIDAITSCEGKSLEMGLQRDGEMVVCTVTPELVENESYYIGFASYGQREKCGAMSTLKYAANEVGYWIRAVIGSLGMIFKGKATLDDVSGPVGVVSTIGNVVEQSKSDGWFYVFLNLFNMTVMISANLGVMNLLPLPALDGGRLLFIIIEILRGKPVSKEKEGMVHFVGMILLMLLMIVVLVNDVSNLF